MRILGLSSGFHDAAAALVVDGEIVAAVEEERLSRVKHDARFPAAAADACLAIAGIEARDVDRVACHEKPLEVVNRHLAGRVRSGPRSLGPLLTETPGVISVQLGVGGRVQRWFRDRGCRTPPVDFVEHHVSHAAAAFYPSPFDSAAVLTIDGVGEWSTSTMGFGHGRRLRVDRELRYPESVGLLYSAFTAYCGFAVNSGEGELMGLAPFGEARFVEQILDRVVEIGDDGSVHLDQRYFAYLGGRRMTSRHFHRLFGGPPRPRGAEPTQREADLAASVQAVLERIVMAMARRAHLDSGSPNLCLSGGVALNCVANARVRTEGPFDDVWVQPASGDSGSALGAALWTWHETLGNPRPAAGGSGGTRDRMRGSFLGPRFTPDEIGRWLEAEAVAHRRVPDRAELCRIVAGRLAAGEVVGWFSGRMEFGPRALGHRSLLADARSASVKRRLNEAVKERATFRPFAPAVLADHASEWFEAAGDAPFMTFVAPVVAQHRSPGAADAGSIAERADVARSEIPAVTHVDGSARVQTVDAFRNPELFALLEEFHRVSGCPVLLNTSFNARDEPIVCTPEDALGTFRRIGVDLLVLEDALVERDE